MEENKWISQLKEHWKKGVYALLLLVCIGVWSERFYHRHQNHASHDYLVVRQIFERFKQGHPLAQESLEVAERIVKKHPQLHASYDAMLAQSYFAKSDIQHALPYTQSVLKRTSSFLHPYFVDFATTTSCIAQGDTETAYQQAMHLEEVLQQTPEFQQLRTFNLLRLAFLAQATGRGDACTTWNTSLQDMPSYRAIASLFAVGSLSLQDYFKQLN